MNLEKKKIILVSNITDHSGPTEGLVGFLRPKSQILLTICHPFFYCQDKRSKIELWQNGVLVKKKTSRQIFLPEFLKYGSDLLMTIYEILIFWQKVHLFIGVNCFFACLGVLYRQLGLVGKVVFYSIDWAPRRFANPFFNRLYYYLDSLAVKKADYIWNLSEELFLIRKKQGVPESKNLLVPNGVNFEEIKKVKREEINRQTLVLTGALHETKGVDLIIETMPKIWREFPEVKLVVIGMTPKVAGIKPYEEIFRSLDSRVSVLGTLPHEKILAIMPEMGIGLSPYLPVKSNLSQYAWPARVIDYLACGLPVIITDVPQVAKRIERQKAGILIEYDSAALANAVKKLLTDDRFYFSSRENAVSLVKHLNWENIFTKAFKQMK